MQASFKSYRSAFRGATSGLALLAALLAAPGFAADEVEAEVKAPAAAARKPAKPQVAAKAAPKAKASPEKSAAAKPPGPAAAAKNASATAASRQKAAATAAAAKPPANQGPGPLADFGKVEAPADVMHVANWVSWSRNNKNKAFVLIDKKMARLYVFEPNGKLKSHTPVLLGKAVGDYTAPGVGNKPISQLRDDEKTTPAGRFLAVPGKNLSGEDIIWIDYNSAVSMHRLRKVHEEERRAERLATPDVEDNRISNGCVNIPHAFYNGILKPTVMKQGAYVYVLPESRTPQQLFGSVDPPAGVQVAEAPAAKSEPAAARKARP